MINFLRKIRQNMLSNGSTSKYLKYAFGEILLVVIGILIALSINNWNEDRKADRMAMENYQNLLRSLEQDSVTVHDALQKSIIALGALEKIIPLKQNKELLELDEEKLNKYLIELTYAGRSFIPKSGVYNVLTSNNGFELIKSDKIKSMLINLYDYQYKTYEDVDGQIDEKYHNELASTIREKVGHVVQFTPELQVKVSGAKELFIQHYDELSAESRDIYGMLSYNRMFLLDIQKSIHELTSLIREELKE